MRRHAATNLSIHHLGPPFMHRFPCPVHNVHKLLPCFSAPNSQLLAERPLLASALFATHAPRCRTGRPTSWDGWNHGTRTVMPCVRFGIVVKMSELSEAICHDIPKDCSQSIKYRSTSRNNIPERVELVTHHITPSPCPARSEPSEPSES